MRIYILFIFLLGLVQVNAQVITNPDNFRTNIKKIGSVDQLPENLLNGKAVVVHAYPNAALTYKKNAFLIQPGLKKAGVDAVAHYLFDDIFSGVEIIEAYQRQLKDRQIDFIIYYLAGNQDEMLIMPYQDAFFGENAFALKSEDKDKLLNNLYLTAERSPQKKGNMLILDVASYPEVPKFIEGRRAEFYDLNMKSGKVAIPRTSDSTINRTIDSIMTAYYPYKYGFVAPGLSEAELRKEGYWFIMYSVHGSGKSVRQLLEYEIKPGETAFASVVADGSESDEKLIDAKAPVYKFYIKHIQNKDVYLGKHYDADEKWEVALKKYILNLKNVLDR